jgi:hypothetical protein
MNKISFRERVTAFAFSTNRTMLIAVTKVLLVTAMAKFAQGANRGLSETAPPQKAIDLQRRWVNWNICTNAFKSKNFTSLNYFNPENTFFLAGAKFGEQNETNCSVVIERTGTINTGTQTLFFPLINRWYPSVSNDWELNLCGYNTSEQAESYRFNDANSISTEWKSSSTFTSGLYSKVDGTDVPYFYVYDNGTFFLEQCPGNELCGPDDCDAEPIVSCDKWDVYPMFGWYSMDSRDWVDGDTHTYEFGGKTECIVVKYAITAKGSGGSNETKKSGGLFRFGFKLCLVTWFVHLLSMF